MNTACCGSPPARASAEPRDFAHKEIDAVALQHALRLGGRVFRVMDLPTSPRSCAVDAAGGVDPFAAIWIPCTA